MTDRLTNDLRGTIKIHAVSHAFKAREEALSKAKTAFADALHQHAFGKEAELVLRLPKEWHNLGSEIHFEGCGWGAGRWKETEPVGNFKLSKERPFPPCGSRLELTKAHPLAERAQQLSKEAKAIEQGKESLRGKLGSLLRSVTTVKKLLELWPEGAQFLPSAPPKQYAIVPITLTNEINQMLGLASKASPAKKAVAKAMAK